MKSLKKKIIRKKNKNEIDNKYRLKNKKYNYLYENKLKEIMENFEKEFKSYKYDEKIQKIIKFNEINEIIESTYNAYER